MCDSVYHDSKGSIERETLSVASPLGFDTTFGSAAPILSEPVSLTENRISVSSAIQTRGTAG